MATKRRQVLRDISSVVASTTVVINCPTGPRYHMILLQHGYAAGTNTLAGAASNITAIRVKRNGRVQRTMSGTDLRDANCFFGAGYDFRGVPNTAPGVAIPIYFGEPWRQEPDAQDALAWSTDGWSSFTIEVDLGAAGTPTLIAYAVVDDVVNRNAIVKWIKAQIGASGTAFDYTQFDKRDFYQQISIYPDSGASNAISRATFRVNGEILHELAQLANEALLNMNGMATNPTLVSGSRTANIYDLVFDHDGLLGSAVSLLGVRDVNLTIEAGAAMSGTTKLIIQRLGAPE